MKKGDKVVRIKSFQVREELKTIFFRSQWVELASFGKKVGTAFIKEGDKFIRQQLYACEVGRTLFPCMEAVTDGLRNEYRESLNARLEFFKKYAGEEEMVRKCEKKIADRAWETFVVLEAKDGDIK